MMDSRDFLAMVGDVEIECEMCSEIYVSDDLDRQFSKRLLDVNNSPTGVTALICYPCTAKIITLGMQAAGLWKAKL